MDAEAGFDGIPSATHEVLAKLMDMGIIKFIISQNTDGLHRLSGMHYERHLLQFLNLYALTMFDMITVKYCSYDR